MSQLSTSRQSTSTSQSSTESTTEPTLDAGSNGAQLEALDIQSSGTATYAVSPGDSLSTIAERGTGDPMRYPELKELNGLDSDALEVGDMLEIPADWDHAALGITAPSVEPEPSPETDVPQAEQGEGGFLDDLWDLGEEAVEGAQDLWDKGVDLVEGAKDAWDEFWGGEEEAPEEVEAPAEVEPSELEALMAQERLEVEQIARARELIEQEPEERRATLYEQLQSKVEYLNQRNNESSQETDDGGTCNLTSLAMCLMYLGVPNPDPTKQYEDALVDICVEKGWSLTAGQTWMDLGTELGVTVTPQHDGQGTNDREWYETTLRGWLQGGGVIVSIHGHVVRIEGVSEDGLIVDDPYGGSILTGTTGREWTDEDGDSTINEQDQDGTDAGNQGEDHLWPWANVEPFSFKCFYTVSA